MENQYGCGFRSNQVQTCWPFAFSCPKVVWKVENIHSFDISYQSTPIMSRQIISITAIVVHSISHRLSIARILKASVRNGSTIWWTTCRAITIRALFSAELWKESTFYTLMRITQVQSTWGSMPTPRYRDHRYTGRQQWKWNRYLNQHFTQFQGKWIYKCQWTATNSNSP